MKKYSVGLWRFPRNVGSRAHKLQKTARFIAAETDEEICIASGFLGNDESFHGMGRIFVGNGS